jgi:hypothetical protein
MYVSVFYKLHEVAELNPYLPRELVDLGGYESSSLLRVHWLQAGRAWVDSRDNKIFAYFLNVPSALTIVNSAFHPQSGVT